MRGGPLLVWALRCLHHQPTVTIEVNSTYRFSAHCILIDELPEQFQRRKGYHSFSLFGTHIVSYNLHPTQRGVYRFGVINILAQSPWRLVVRHFKTGVGQTVKVYPSFVHMRRYSLMAVSNQLQQSGIKRIRKMGSSTEFEQIKEYVAGDDYRNINWKASARKGDVMVTQFTDERSQQLFSVINTGRLMKMPFEGLSLLDYAINASLALSQVSLLRSDKAGLLTLGRRVDAFVPADKREGQLHRIQEVLYQVQTGFPEPDLEALFSFVRSKIKGRSLLVYFTNYETVEAVHRDLPLLQNLARYHLLLVVLFQNTEVEKLTKSAVYNTEDIYVHTIANKYMLEKKKMIAAMQAGGLMAMATPPQQLTPKLLNKYLEIKMRQRL